MIIRASVGENGANLLGDVQTIQSLLNEWREQRRAASISVDGVVGHETLSAIRLLQKQETHIIDGRIDPGGPALKVLALSHERLVLNYVFRNCKTVLDNLDLQLRLLATPLPLQLQASISSVKMRVNAIRPQISQPTQANVVPKLLLGFRVGSPIFGAIQVTIPLILILVIFALLFMMSIIIARPALEHLAKQLRILLNAIADALRGIKKTLEDAFKLDLPRAQKCQDPFRLAMALIDEIFQDLIDLSISGQRNPFVLNRLVDKLKRLERLANEFLKCMGLPLITLLGS
jgi:hypothetical protein